MQQMNFSLLRRRCVCLCVCVCMCESREGGGWGDWQRLFCLVTWGQGRLSVTRLRCMLGKADCWTTVNPFSMENIWLKWVKVCSYVCGDLWSIRSTFISQ